MDKDPQESRSDAAAALERLDWVRGLARSLVRDASLADDITQEAWLAAVGRPAAEGVASRGWLAPGVRNAARQENRGTEIRREHEERTRLHYKTASTDELVERVHTQRFLSPATWSGRMARPSTKVRVRLVGPEYWSEFTLAARDAHSGRTWRTSSFASGLALARPSGGGTSRAPCSAAP